MLLPICLVGCTSARDLRVASAGSVGCAPAEIEVSQVRGGTSGRSWIARCDGASFQCSVADAGCVSCAPVRGRGARRHGRERGVAGDASTGEGREGREAREGREGRDGREDQAARAGGAGPRFQFVREGEALRGVRATFRAGAATLVFTFTPERDRDALHLALTPGEGATPAECGTLTLEHGGSSLLSATLHEGETRLPRQDFVAHVTRAEPAPTFRFCGHAWTPSPAERQGFQRLAEHVAQALADTPAPASDDMSAAVTATAPTAEAERGVRAQLDARGPALRACAGVLADEPLALEATWDAVGVVRVQVRGRDDRAVHECARSVLRGWRAPSGSPGRVIHVLEAR